MADDMTPERARALLAMPDGGCRAAQVSDADDAWIAAGPELARAYLAAVERAERAEAVIMRILRDERELHTAGRLDPYDPLRLAVARAIGEWAMEREGDGHA